MNRREFIQASFFSSIAFLASCRNALTPPPALEQTADVLVIGAGMAGIAAAQALRQRGLTVTILEARERVGGRVWTDRSWQGTALDLGASWIHGTKKNPLTELVKQFNIKTLPTHYDSHTVYDANGRALNESERDSIDARLRQLQKNASAVRDERQVRGDADISLGQAFEQIRANQNLTRAEQRKLDHAINATIEHEFAADVSDLSLYQFDEDKQFRGDDVLFPDGYDQLVKKLADGLDIRLEQVVTKIELDEAGVNVTTNRGVFQAARVLITLPLGVLKSGAVVFIPALPERKAAAIRRLGMGVLNKVYLRFTAPFWAKEPELLGYIAESKGEWAEFLNIFKYTDAPILLGFNAGTYGAAIEKFADAEIIAQAMRVLRRIYGAAAADPQAALITRWASDPFARGSYSYPTVGTSEDDYAALAEPIDARLFFAGEATNKDYPSTVHGAYLSGIREADRIANLR